MHPYVPMNSGCILTYPTSRRITNILTYPYTTIHHAFTCQDNQTDTNKMSWESNAMDRVKKYRMINLPVTWHAVPSTQCHTTSFNMDESFDLDGVPGFSWQRIWWLSFRLVHWQLAVLHSLVTTDLVSNHWQLCCLCDPLHSIILGLWSYKSTSRWQCNLTLSRSIKSAPLPWIIHQGSWGVAFWSYRWMGADGRTGLLGSIWFHGIFVPDIWLW